MMEQEAVISLADIKKSIENKKMEAHARGVVISGKELKRLDAIMLSIEGVSKNLSILDKPPTSVETVVEEYSKKIDIILDYCADFRTNAHMFKSSRFYDLGLARLLVRSVVDASSVTGVVAAFNNVMALRSVKPHSYLESLPPESIEEKMTTTIMSMEAEVDVVLNRCSFINRQLKEIQDSGAVSKSGVVAAALNLGLGGEFGKINNRFSAKLFPRLQDFVDALFSKFFSDGGLSLAERMFSKRKVKRSADGPKELSEDGVEMEGPEQAMSGSSFKN